MPYRVYVSTGNFHFLIIFFWEVYDHSNSAISDINGQVGAIEEQLSVYLVETASSENEFIQKIINRTNPKTRIMYSVGATWTNYDYYWVTFFVMAGYLVGTAICTSGRFLKIYGLVNSVSVAEV